MRLLQILGLVTLLLLSIPVNGQNNQIQFQNAQITISFVEDDFISSSLSLKFEGLPDLHGYVFEIQAGDLVSDQFSENTTVNFGENIITASDTIILNLVNIDDTINLIKKSVEAGVYFHLKHVYSNWTSGQPPPPDKRGLGVGAVLDVQTLGSVLPTQFTTIEQAEMLSEQILNLMLDTPEDRNGDGVIEQISDGFGMLEYIYGMRDHISNAGNSGDATTEISALAQAINTNLSSSIIESGNYGTFLTRLNESDAEMTVLYQDAISLNSANLTEANIILDDISSVINNQIFPIIKENLNKFRNLVLGGTTSINTTIELNLSDQTTGTSNSEEAGLDHTIGTLLVFLFVARYTRLRSSSREAGRIQN